MMYSVNHGLWWTIFLASLLLAPLLFGIINKVKAFFGGRCGPRLLQLYYDMFKLSRKAGIFSRTSSGVLQLAPIVSLLATVMAMLFIPGGLFRSPLAFGGDVIFFCYLLGLSRMLTILAAMDTGSSFAGMGASREAHFSVLAEAVLFAIVVFLAIVARSICLSDLLSPLSLVTPGISVPAVLLVAGAFFIIILVENCRLPFDDPETHLELTMIHEAMILDYAGPELAMIHYTASLKLWSLCAVLALLLLPQRVGGALTGVLAYLALIVAFAVGIGVVESIMARYRFLKVPHLLVGSLAAVLTAVLLLLFF
ncbi:MAG: NADH-quinone oxidoreductase subunit H [Lentisphaeria bacterium]|nr:NADH-quinone oxidoreductase subunit H [Lentisphaeria bacterium]